MSDQDFILAPTSIITDFVVEPVTIILHSLQLVTMVDHFSGFDDWVTRTDHDLSPEERQMHAIVMDDFFHALMPRRRWDSFLNFLDDLESQDAQNLMVKSLEWVEDHEDAPAIDTLLQDETAYIEFVRARVAHKAEKYGEKISFDEARSQRVFQMRQDAEATQQQIVAHLRMMWERFLADEWARAEPVLQEAVAAYSQIDYSGLSYYEIVEAVTGRDFRDSKFMDDNNMTRLVFVPSPHIGPYVGLFPGYDKTMRTIFRAQAPKGIQTTSPALSRSELLIRLNALADDTRLQMLELLVQNEELCAQDFINMLGLSQSSASRHLRQLTASGYLTERRKEVAKCYSLNRDRIDDTVAAIKGFLSSR